MANTIRIKEMLNDCEEASSVPESNGGPGFTKWELDFLDSIRLQFEDRGTLSAKQVDVLERMWHKI